MTRDDVIDVLTAIAAADRRTVGHADVDVWQAVIGELDKNLALKAVRDHLRDAPGTWLEPGHVHQRVRAMVRDRLEREPDRDREARQKMLEAKVAELADERTATKLLEQKYKRPTGNTMNVRCPWCGSGPGVACVVPRTNRRPAGGSHPARLEAARKAS